MKYLAPALLLTTALLTACGGDKTSGNSGNDSGNNPGNTSPDVTTRLTSCGVVSSMNGCLAGSYSGKTLSGEACTVTIKADGGYTFAAPRLNYTYATTAQTVQTYSHSISSGQHTLNWSETDPSGTRLQLSSTFGTGVAAPLADLTGTSGGQSETCRVGLTATATPGGGTGEVSTLTRLSGQVYDEQKSYNNNTSRAVAWSGGAQTLKVRVLDSRQQQVASGTGNVSAGGQLSVDLPATVDLSQSPVKPVNNDPGVQCSDNLTISDRNAKGALGDLVLPDGSSISGLNDTVSLSDLYPGGVSDTVLLQYSDRAVTITGDQTCTVTVGNAVVKTTVHHNSAFKKGWNLIRMKRWLVSGEGTTQVYEINQTSITTVPAHWLSAKTVYIP